jgi:hypothetical protein
MPVLALRILHPHVRWGVEQTSTSGVRAAEAQLWRNSASHLCPEVEPRGLEPLTPCLQRGGITGHEVRLALVDPHLDSPGCVEWWHRCCTSLLYVGWCERVSAAAVGSV